MGNCWQVYIIEASDGTLYTGITTDVRRRWQEHSSGARGARYFRGRVPRALVFLECGYDRSAACRREIAIKRLRRRDKLKLIESACNELERYGALVPARFAAVLGEML